MKPKDKAKELIYKYAVETQDYLNDDLYRPIIYKRVSTACALVAVEEILSEGQNNIDPEWGIDDREKYWLQVKEEILNF